MVYSIAALLITGSEPGRPRQTGQVCEFGSAPKTVGQPQNIFDAVASSTWVSSPITGSYLVTASSNGTSSALIAVVRVIARPPRPGRAPPPFPAPPSPPPPRPA